MQGVLAAEAGNLGRTRLVFGTITGCSQQCGSGSRLSHTNMPELLQLLGHSGCTPHALCRVCRALSTIVKPGV